MVPLGSKTVHLVLGVSLCVTNLLTITKSEDLCKLGCQLDVVSEEAALLQRHPAGDPRALVEAGHSLAEGTLVEHLRKRRLCKALRRAVSGQVLCASEVKNNYSFDAYNPQCEQLVPEIVVFPASAEDVQAVVKLTRQHKWKRFSIRGGGHSYTCMSFKSRSVHVDMRAMKAFAWTEDSTHGYARLGPGLVLKDLQDQIPEGFQYAIGSCWSVGVIGFLIHGGSSPRTKWLGNSTIYSMDVVTADGRALTLSDKMPHDGLWYAMRMAGSSFAAVTSLTIRLERKPQRGFLLVPTNNSFEELLAALDQPTNDNDTWKGLFRFDRIAAPHNMSGMWFLKLSPPGSVTRETIALIQGAGTMHSGAAAPPEAPWLQEVTSWTRRHGLRLDLARAMLPEAWSHPSYISRRPGGSGYSSRFSYRSRQKWQAAGHQNVWEGAVITDASSMGGWVPAEKAMIAAKVMHAYFAPLAWDCSWDFGPLKGPLEDVFIDISAFTVEAIHDLDAYVKKHGRDLGMARRYVNLPAWGTPFKEYWPNYNELAEIKSRWDPADLFDIPNGIH